jgi:hypothetical protein
MAENVDETKTVVAKIKAEDVVIDALITIPGDTLELDPGSDETERSGSVLTNSAGILDYDFVFFAQEKGISYVFTLAAEGATKPARTKKGVTKEEIDDNGRTVFCGRDSGEVRF